MVSWYKNEESFYAMTTAPDVNVEETTFESGKSRYTLKNSSPKKIHKCSFLVKTKTEETTFWNWYENTLLSRTQNVRLTNLVTHSGNKEYQMTEEPSFTNSQYPKECTVTFKEV